MFQNIQRFIQDSFVLKLILFCLLWLAIVTVSVTAFILNFKLALCIVIILNIIFFYTIHKRNKLNRIKDPRQKIDYYHKRLQKGRMTKKHKYLCYNGLCVHYYLVGDFEKALNCNEKALEYLEQIKKGVHNRGFYLANQCISLINRMEFYCALDKGSVLPDLINQAEPVLKDYINKKRLYTPIKPRYLQNDLMFVKVKASLYQGDVTGATGYCNEAISDDDAFNEAYQYSLWYRRLLIKAEIKMVEGAINPANQILELLIKDPPNLHIGEKAKILQKRVLQPE